MAETLPANAQAWRIVNAHAFLPDGLVAGAKIATEGAVIGDPYGDAFERRLMPRPGVFLSDDLALRAARYRPPARRQARRLGAIGICFALGVLSPRCARRCFGLDRGGPRGAERVQRPHAGPARPQSARSSAPVEAVSQNSRSRAKRPQWQAQQASM